MTIDSLPYVVYQYAEHCGQFPVARFMTEADAVAYMDRAYPVGAAGAVLKRGRQRLIDHPLPKAKP